MSNKNIKFPVSLKCLHGDFFEVDAVDNQIELHTSIDSNYLTPDQALALAAALVSAANEANTQLGSEQK